MPAFSALKENAKLPDPFTMMDGTKVTTLAQWVCRHQEISAMVQNYETGSKGAKKATVKGTASSGSLKVDVSGGAQAVSFSVTIKLPSTGTAPYPAMFGVDGGSLDNSKFLSMGIATVNLPTSIHPETNRASGAIAKFNGDSKSGQLIGLAWAMSRIIDALETTPDAQLDPKRLGITGCSRLGKAALMIGAMDSRVALTIPEDSGSGGVAAWRVSEADNGGKTGSDGVQNLSRTYSEAQWFSTDIEQFGNAVNKLPLDHHELVAMVAPRGLLILSNTDYTWLGCNNADQSGAAAKMVYDALGATQNIGYIDSGHTHCGTLPAAELAAIEAFAKKFLLNDSSASTDVWKPKFAIDKTKWVDWTPPAAGSLK
jgi:hypothetical protein